jgi:glucose/arabinose dehydrogenase
VGRWRHRLCTLAGILVIPAAAWLPARAVDLTTETISTGLNRPLFVTAAPGDTARIFILEQTGRVIVHRNNGIESVFLDLTDSVTCCGEQGLLGLAFHPDYETNGYFYVSYTTEGPTPGGKSRIVRYRVSDDPDVAEVDSAVTLLEEDQPFTNHNGGMIGFGPADGYLYIGFGDGGSGGDPGNRAQDLTTLLGKILRIDVDSRDPGLEYGVPSDNPFGDEIWALGLRNPWRWSFDRSTADLWIADVGQQNWEEINFQPASSAGGENYGWRCREGMHDYNFSGDCALKTFTDPFTEYGHTNGRCSITGGFVYRGDAIPSFDGKYFYGDYCTGEIWSLRYGGSTVTDSVEHTAALNPGGNNITSFGQDARGEIYFTVLSASGGIVYKIVPSPVACCSGSTGNIDGDIEELVDIGDLTALIDYLYISLIEPDCLAEANIDGDVQGIIDIGDLTALIDFLYINNTPPANCP